MKKKELSILKKLAPLFQVFSSVVPDLPKADLELMIKELPARLDK